MFDLPENLEAAGKTYAIRTDFRDILQILIAFASPELSESEKMHACLYILYIDFDKMPRDAYEAAFEAAVRFIDNGIESNGPSKPTMDWEQDAPLLFPAVNRVAGFETRSVEYLHWWTFLGYFMEIKDSVYASILNLRSKKAKGKKLEKKELEFWRANRKLCELREKLTEDEQAEKDRLNAIFK